MWPLPAGTTLLGPLARKVSESCGVGHGLYHPPWHLELLLQLLHVGSREPLGQWLIKHYRYLNDS